MIPNWHLQSLKRPLRLIQPDVEPKVSIYCCSRCISICCELSPKPLICNFKPHSITWPINFIQFPYWAVLSSCYFQGIPILHCPPQSRCITSERIIGPHFKTVTLQNPMVQNMLTHVNPSFSQPSHSLGPWSTPHHLEVSVALQAGTSSSPAAAAPTQAVSAARCCGATRSRCTNCWASSANIPVSGWNMLEPL